MKEITPFEAAKRLGVTKQTIYNWIGNKKISHKKVFVTKELIRIDEDEIRKIKLKIALKQK